MVTTKRSDSVKSSLSDYNQGGVGLLEREAPATDNQYAAKTPAKDENFEAARERMQRNLNALLNYDKVEEKVEQPAVENSVATENLTVTNEMQDDDIRPTLTTMQFGDGDIDQMRAEMRADTTVKDKYHLSGKGKVAIVLYSLAITVIMALIVLNTGLLANLRNDFASKSAALNDAMTQYASLQEDIEQASSNQKVIDTAVNELGMVTR